MKRLKIILVIIIITISQSAIGQDFSDSWIGHFSYLDIVDVSKGTSKIFGAAENAIFSYDIATNETDRISTINGLSGENISAIKYIEDKGILLVGFENGLIQIYNESNNEFVTVIDILEKPTIPPNDKQINHFMVNNDFVYISTGFGISVYDIDNLEFGDTYFIGIGGIQINVNQTEVFGDYIYVASEHRIYRALIDNPNLINYLEWEIIVGGNFIGVQRVGEKLYAARTNKTVHEIVETTVTQLIVYPDDISGFISVGDQLVVTTKNNVIVYSENFDVLIDIGENDDFVTDYTRAITGNNNDIYIGTKSIDATGKPGYGFLKTSFNDPSIFEEIHPESPLKNKFFQIETQAGQVWGVHGGHSVTYNFNGGLRRSGISRYRNEEWENITYDSLNIATPNPWYLSYLSIDPFSDKVFVSSYIRGLIEINSEEILLYNQNNSTLVPFAGSLHLTLASHFDKDGALWVMNGRVDTSLNKFKDGVWTDYSLLDIINPRTSNLGFSDLSFTDDGKVFIGSLNYGIIGFNESNGDLKFIEDIELNMPSQKVWAVEVDRQNQVWVGTDSGLRVINNTSEFFDDTAYQPSDIIILDDGIPRELLFQQYITDIEVDGSNNKWISTLDTGVYYLSSDGLETIFHFTKNNSPLPSNDVLDVAIDDTNGIVYFATEKGLVAFKSDTSKPEETLTGAYVYPNPVRPTFNITDDKVKIKGLTDNVNIKITDIEGNLVTEAESRTNSKFRGYNLEIDGGTALWNGKNLADRIVASGVYLVMISDLDSFETKVLKVMIVR